MTAKAVATQNRLDIISKVNGLSEPVGRDQEQQYQRSQKSIDHVSAVGGKWLVGGPQYTADMLFTD